MDAKTRDRTCTLLLPATRAPRVSMKPLLPVLLLVGAAATHDPSAEPMLRGNALPGGGGTEYLGIRYAS
eukprot:COSAG06_NODE_2878_length_6140_cov_22.906307_6_plen_68_part_01